MSQKIIVFLYIDALNDSFLTSNNMPFLSILAKNCFKKLDNVLGYSFAIQSCLLSGKYPDQTNHWMPYFYSPQESPVLFRNLKKIGRVFPLDKMPLFRHLAVGRTRSLFMKDGVHANNIPLQMLDKIALFPYYYMCELPFFHELRNILQSKFQASLEYFGPPTLREQMYSQMLRHLNDVDHQNELVVVYDDALDGLGHKFGPFSKECFEYARALDRNLSLIYRKLIDLFGKNLTLFIFSDHGQCEQISTFDLMHELSRHRLRHVKDFVCFVDATLALFWPSNDSVKEKLMSILKKLEGCGLGKVVHGSLHEKYHIKFADARYGELYFVLKPGVTFFPNFFSPISSMKGLHGYLPEENVQKSFVVSNKPPTSNLCKVGDIKNTLLELFN